MFDGHDALRCKCLLCEQGDVLRDKQTTQEDQYLSGAFHYSFLYAASRLGLSLRKAPKAEQMTCGYSFDLRAESGLNFGHFKFDIGAQRGKKVIGLGSHRFGDDFPKAAFCLRDL